MIALTTVYEDLLRREQVDVLTVVYEDLLRGELADVLAAVYEGLPIRLGRLKSCKQCHAISSKQDDKKGRSFSFKRKGKEED